MLHYDFQSTQSTKAITALKLLICFNNGGIKKHMNLGDMLIKRNFLLAEEQKRSRVIGGVLLQVKS